MSAAVKDAPIALFLLEGEFNRVRPSITDTTRWNDWTFILVITDIRRWSMVIFYGGDFDFRSGVIRDHAFAVPRFHTQHFAQAMGVWAQVRVS